MLMIDPELKVTNLSVRTNFIKCLMIRVFTKEEMKGLKTVKASGNLLFACQDNLNNLR